MAHKKMIFILGMHRSGTSAATRLLNILGASLPGNLLPPDPHINEKGYFEDKDVVSLNETLLSHLHAAWYDIKDLPPNWWKKEDIISFRGKIQDILKQNYGAFDLAMIKDPRLSILFPLWRDAVQGLFEPLSVIVLRRPEEVAASLFKRDGLDKSYGYYLWMRYVLSSFAHTMNLKRTFITFDQILSNPGYVSETLEKAFDIEWPETLTAQKEKISRDISRDLKHHACDKETIEPDNALLKMAVEIYHKLTSPDSDPEIHGNYFSEIKQKLDAPNDPTTTALKDSLQNTNRRMIENTIKMMALGEMHSHALDVIGDKDKQLSEQNQVITTLRKFQENVVSHWAWPIMRRLPAKGVNLND